MLLKDMAARPFWDALNGLYMMNVCTDVVKGHWGKKKNLKLKLIFETSNRQREKRVSSIFQQNNVCVCVVVHSREDHLHRNGCIASDGPAWLGGPGQEVHLRLLSAAGQRALPRQEAAAGG